MEIPYQVRYGWAAKAYMAAVPVFHTKGAIRVLATIQTELADRFSYSTMTPLSGNIIDVFNQDAGRATDLLIHHSNFGYLYTLSDYGHSLVSRTKDHISKIFSPDIAEEFFTRTGEIAQRDHRQSPLYSFDPEAFAKYTAEIRASRLEVNRIENDAKVRTSQIVAAIKTRTARLTQPRLDHIAELQEARKRLFGPN